MIVGCVMDSNVNEMFGKNLKSLIKKVGLTQKKFGEELGVNKNTVYYWCKGKYIRLEDINKIIKYFLLNPKIKDFSRQIPNERKRHRQGRATRKRNFAIQTAVASDGKINHKPDRKQNHCQNRQNQI